MNARVIPKWGFRVCVLTRTHIINSWAVDETKVMTSQNKD
jgi:hypothetical protein